MNTKTLSIKEVAQRLKLPVPHVRKLVKTGELTATNTSSRSLIFSQSEIETFAEKLKEKKLASLKMIAQASEEVGLYDISDDN